MSRSDLARRQAELVAALVTGAPVPVGFDERLIGVAAAALAAKRAGEVAARWPMLRLHFGPHWTAEFQKWSAGRAPQGALRDGWDLARANRHRLSAPARLELAEHEAVWHYDGAAPPRRRRAPKMTRAGALVLVQVAGRVGHLRLGPHRRSARTR